MCSIAGFSLSEKSKINPRRLSKALLVEMDVRGNQAAGFAWQSSTGSGIYKQAVSGAQLSMKPMSKAARLGVLHTRYATHGSINVSANNHPVMSPDKNIALVHNGVIYNHDLVRGVLDGKLAEVDTAVIPAILQQYDRDFSKLEMLDGDAAISWLDETDRLTLRVARVSHSPLIIAQLQDGSFIFASTESMLVTACKKLGLQITFLESVPERSLLTVRNGRLDAVEVLPNLHPDFEQKFDYSAGYYRNMTSGGHGSAKASAAVFSDLYSYTERGDGKGRSYTSPWGDMYVPEEWFEDSGTDNNGFPSMDGYYCNEFGEYFENDSKVYVGSYDDFTAMNWRPMSNRFVRDWDNDWD
jgi:asparagine synthetase B (glutamine-hydrolysing)